MIEQSYTWTTPEKKSIFAQSWTPEQVGKQTILLVHGLGEHSGRYKRWAELFTEKGFNVLALDLQGHGKSDGKRGHVRSIEKYLDEIDLLFSEGKVLFPESKFILYGHSMGGNLVLNHVIRRNHPVAALISTSPWLKLTNPPSDFLITLVSFLKKIIPSFTIPNGLNADDISHDPEIARYYISDPLNHNKISFRLFYEINQAGLHALRNVYKINYPFLLLHGTADNITSPKASEEYVRNTTKRTRLKLWEGQYHELHNELIYKEVFNYIIEWLAEYNLVQKQK
ncbi:MAG: lysophospholipase [Bacteroidales bacterium]|nr:lysophospholipase [Bacteroidales bacterium]MCF8392198.1 lysophospholipase [Bacteroidales bacterium]